MGGLYCCLLQQMGILRPLHFPNLVAVISPEPLEKIIQAGELITPRA
jgi:hypothetical protein